MSIVSLSLHRVWPFVSHADSWLLPFRAVCSEGLLQLSGLTLWAVSWLLFFDFFESMLCDVFAQSFGAVMRIVEIFEATNDSRRIIRLTLNDQKTIRRIHVVIDHKE